MSSPVQQPVQRNAQLLPSMNDQSAVSGRTVFQMLFYTFLMVTVPISSYFLSRKRLFEDYFGYTEETSLVPAALTAVVMIHVVLGLFLYSAFTEDIPSKPKRD